jgi:hypothetical protein
VAADGSRELDEPPALVPWGDGSTGFLRLASLSLGNGPLQAGSKSAVSRSVPIENSNGALGFCNELRALVPSPNVLHSLAACTGER